MSLYPSPPKNCMWLVISLNLEPLFCCRIVVLGLLRLNIKARHNLPEFLMQFFDEASYHNGDRFSIAFYVDWSLNIFILLKFCSMIIEQFIDLKKVRTENSKFRTDIWEQVIDGWSATQKMIVHNRPFPLMGWGRLVPLLCGLNLLGSPCGAGWVNKEWYKGRLLKKSPNRKLKLVLSTVTQHWSLHRFQTSHFICYLFGCKFWLGSIQNHAWHCFQAFAHRHLT